MLDSQTAWKYKTVAFEGANSIHKQWRKLYNMANSLEGVGPDGYAIGDAAKPGSFNVIKGLRNQIVNPVIKTPPEITCLAGDGATESGASALNGHLRALQTQCDAPADYIHALQDMVDAGVGCFSFRTVDPDDPGYDDAAPGIDDEEDNKIGIATQYHCCEDVAFDPSATHRFKRDARFCAIRFKQNRDDFLSAFPKAKSVLDVTEKSDGDDRVEFFELWYRNGEAKRIERYILVEAQIVYSCIDYKGGAIPVVWMQGPSSVDEKGGTILQPLTYLLYDSQDVINYWHRTMIDLIASAPKATWTSSRRGIQQEDLKAYQEAAANPDVVLFYDTDKPERVEPPEIPQTYLECQNSELNFIRNMTGLFPNGMDYMQKELDAPSGKAQTQQRMMSDIASAQYIGAFESALRWGGKLLVDLVVKYQNDDAIRVSIGADGRAKSVSFGPTPIGKDRGIINVDLAMGKYHVVVQTGASYATQKQELLEKLGELASRDEAFLKVLSPYLVGQWSIPGSEELAELLRLAFWPNKLREYAQTLQSNDPEAMVHQLMARLDAMENERNQLTATLQAVTQELNALKDHAQQIQEKGRIDLERQQMSDASRERIVDKQIHGNIVRQQVADENAMARDAQKAEFELEREEMITARELNDSAADRMQY